MKRKMSKQLNDKEKKVLQVIESSVAPDDGGKTEFAPITIAEIAKLAFAKRGTSAKTKGNSWVRNSLRKLRKLHLVRKKGEGTYVRTDKPVPEEPAEDATEEKTAEEKAA